MQPLIKFSYQECNSNDLMDPIVDKQTKERKGRTREVFRKVSKKLSAEKLNRYSKEQLESILNPDGEFNKMLDSSRECSMCHTSKLNVERRKSHDNLGDICINCFNFYKMGKNLVFKKDDKPENIMVMPVRYSKPVSDKPYLELPSIDDKERFLTLEKKWQVEEGLKNNSDNYCRIYTKNAWLAGLKLSTNLWMGDYNKEPELLDEFGNKNLIEFSELADNSLGIKRLAVMRADVDNLGSVFISGFNKKFGTLSRYTTLSRQLSLFFKHFINNICKSNITGVDGQTKECFSIPVLPELSTKNKHLVIVYSGGDDVFIVGSWNDILDFAVDLRRAFKEFTNGKLTFSAGIAFFQDSFPIYQMANMTGKLESLAKDYKKNIDNEKPDKDAVALFGIDKTVNKLGEKIDLNHIYSWDDFENSVYPKLKYFLDNFRRRSDKEVLGELELSTSFLYKLLTLLEADLTEGKYSINLARLAYAMARLESGTSDDDKKLKYRKLKEKVYGWANNNKERKELLTVINLLVYLYREKEKAEVSQ